MSIRITEAGIMDTIQDDGRYGYGAMGINPGGAMDIVAAHIANFLVGNEEHEAVIEMHYPAPVLHFNGPALIAVSGADFSMAIDGIIVPLNTPLIVPAGARLEFKKLVKGARCYLGVQGGFRLSKWLGSYSTNLKAHAGGYGRQLQKGDILETNISFRHPVQTSERNQSMALPFHADTSTFYQTNNTIRIIKGREYDQLSDCSGTIIAGNTFSISTQSDRMGYRMNGSPLKLQEPVEMISSAVTRGTIQLLPNGQIIILMADHQATGGYPRLAHVISADLPTLAQAQPNTPIRFQLVSNEEAESLLLQQYHNLQQIKTACHYRLHQLIN